MATDREDKYRTIISDDDVCQVDSGRQAPPESWCSRRLYLGQKGAANWLNIVHKSRYPLHGKDPFDLEKNRRAALEMISAVTMVSLGSGDALHDIKIVRQLQKKTPNLNYIPVDISRCLLDEAIKTLKGSVNIPVGLQCDFEQVPILMKDAVAKVANRPILFSMLGGTIGNLDLGERHFFETMKSLMEKEDYLLIDIPLAGPAWTASEDPRFNKTEYPEEFKQFLALGISGWEHCSDDETLSSEIEERIEGSIGQGGDIASTKVVSIFDKLNDRVILKFCRYDWESMVQWLVQQNFNIIFSRCSITSNEDKFGMGVVLVSHALR